MSINTTRAQIRLTKSEEAGKSVISEIAKLKQAIETANNDLDQMQVASQIQENIVNESFTALTAVKSKLEQTEDDTAQATLLTEQLQKAQAEVQSIVERYKARRDERTTAEVQLADLEGGATMSKIWSQREALKRREVSYPAALKRHLRKCRKHGWADSRLSAGKK